MAPTALRILSERRARPVASAAGTSLLAILVAATGLAQTEPEPPAAAAAAESIVVVARAVAVDVVDAKGAAVAGVRAEDLTLLEDGVERTILELRRREPLGPAREGSAVSATATLPESPQPLPQGVLVALDPNLVDNFAWKDALRSLRKAAPALAALGPVEVAAVGVPGFEGIDCGQDAARVVAAIERVELDARPLDLFYRNRERFLREARRMIAPETGGGIYLPRMREEILNWFEGATRELVETEVRMLRDAQARLAPWLARKARPLVLVWVAGGDPDTGDFVRQFFEDSWSDQASDAFRITEVAAGAARGGRLALERQWQSWAADGVRVVSWAPERPLVPDLASASYRRPSGARLQTLARDPIGLFDDAARETGGVLVRAGNEIPAALDSVRGRYVLVYQTDRAEPGWRRLEVTAKTRDWKVRAPLSLPVFTLDEERPPELPVDLRVERSPGEKEGTEAIELETRVDVRSLLDRVPASTPLDLELRLFVTLPSGTRLSRDARVALRSIPLDGVVLHRLALTVPAASRDFRVEVREKTTGARGGASAGTRTPQPAGG